LVIASRQARIRPMIRRAMLKTCGAPRRRVLPVEEESTQRVVD
jgi:hypothetical protein